MKDINNDSNKGPFPLHRTTNFEGLDNRGKIEALASAIQGQNSEGSVPLDKLYDSLGIQRSVEENKQEQQQDNPNQQMAMPSNEGVLNNDNRNNRDQYLREEIEGRKSPSPRR